MFIGGNVIIQAWNDLKQEIKQFAATMLAVGSDRLGMADNKVFGKNDPAKSSKMVERGGTSTFDGAYLVGAGAYRPDGPFQVDPKTLGICGDFQPGV